MVWTSRSVAWKRIQSSPSKSSAPPDTAAATPGSSGCQNDRFAYSPNSAYRSSLTNPGSAGVFL